MQQKEISKACDEFELKRGIVPGDTYKDRFNKGVAASMRTRKPDQADPSESKKWIRKPQQVETMSLAMLLIKEVAMAGRRDGLIAETVTGNGDELSMVEFD